MHFKKIFKCEQSNQSQKTVPAHKSNEVEQLITISAIFNRSLWCNRNFDIFFAIQYPIQQFSNHLQDKDFFYMED